MHQAAPLAGVERWGLGLVDAEEVEPCPDNRDTELKINMMRLHWVPDLENDGSCQKLSVNNPPGVLTRHTSGFQQPMPSRVHNDSSNIPKAPILPIPPQLPEGSMRSCPEGGKSFKNDKKHCSKKERVLRHCRERKGGWGVPRCTANNTLKYLNHQILISILLTTSRAQQNIHARINKLRDIDY